MTTRTLISDLVDLTYPLPEPPDSNVDPDGWSAMLDQVAEDREAYEQALRLAWEHNDGYDPLLAEIDAARDAMLAAEARRRLVIPYSREFPRPRPYRLEDVARAAGMSISGTRTAYDEDEIAEITRLTGAKPARPTATS